MTKKEECKDGEYKEKKVTEMEEEEEEEKEEEEECLLKNGMYCMNNREFYYKSYEMSSLFWLLMPSQLHQL